MSKIMCGVTNCYLNKNGNCCSTCIDVCGKDAVSRGSTSCTTFGVRQPGFSNDNMTPPSNSEISCKAENCIHNCGGKCKSQTIQIHGSNVTDSQSTFCTTFSCK